MVGSPQQMVEAEVSREYGPDTMYDVQPLGNGVFTATLYSNEGIDGDIDVTAVLLYQIRAVRVGDPVVLSVALREA